MPKFTVSSGNVYADLGLPDADVLLAKSNLSIRLGQIIKERGLTTTEAAEILGLDAHALMAIRLGKFSECTFDQLEQYNARLEAHQ